MGLDIFSKAKTNKPEEKPRIIIDNREKNSLVPSILIRNNCKIEFNQLKIGDYISGETIIERKTFSDLINSIIDKRIFTRINNLEKETNRLIIIEGDTNKINFNKNSIRGIILFASLNKKIPVVFSKDEEETSKYIILLANKRKKHKISLRENIKFKSKAERIKYILEGFPGIGPSTSEKLIKHFSSIKNIINAKESELKEILGKKTDKFIEIIR